ncbi:MAG: pentapeptide repeat-containing protein [Chloroflexi bacterium]|nr:pentapeptide repeat-containing protein [Chloroflexota bacterium]
MQLQQELSRLEKEIREAREKSEKLVLETESKKRSEAKGSASIKQRIQVIINEARARGEQIDLSGIDLQGVNLQRANLAKAILIEANLESANLFKANLTQAFLENAYLLSADLAGASLVTANLTGANLDGAKGVIKP